MSISPPSMSNLSTHMPDDDGRHLGKYRLISKLGQGGMGEVWLARDTVADIDVAIKFLPEELRNSTEEQERLKSSFQLVQKLSHPAICRLRDLQLDPQIGFFLVMDYVEGVTLAKFRSDAVRREGKFSHELAISLLQPAASALDHAHANNIVHRDIKPANILVSANGRQVSVIDFQLAWELRSSLSRISQKDAGNAGTYPYMAPELWRGRRTSAKSDQYALGIVLFELIDGRLPFDADNRQDWVSIITHPEYEPPVLENVPECFQQAVAVVLSRNPEDRFDTVSQFISAAEGKFPIPLFGSQRGNKADVGTAVNHQQITARENPEESAAWAECERQETAESFEAFLAKYPSGNKSEQASEKLAQILRRRILDQYRPDEIRERKREYAVIDEQHQEDYRWARENYDTFRERAEERRNYDRQREDRISSTDKKYREQEARLRRQYLKRRTDRFKSLDISEAESLVTMPAIHESDKSVELAMPTPIEPFKPIEEISDWEKGGRYVPVGAICWGILVLYFLRWSTFTCGGLILLGFGGAVFAIGIPLLFRYSSTYAPIEHAYNKGVDAFNKQKALREEQSRMLDAATREQRHLREMAELCGPLPPEPYRPSSVRDAAYQLLDEVMPNA